MVSGFCDFPFQNAPLEHRDKEEHFHLIHFLRKQNPSFSAELTRSANNKFNLFHMVLNILTKHGSHLSDQETQRGPLVYLQVYQAEYKLTQSLDERH